MKIDREYFLKRFRSLETDELFEEIADRELSDEALEAVSAVLVERGFSDEDIEERFRAAKKSLHRRSGVTNHCDRCGNSTFFGAVYDGGQKFCSAKCLRATRIAERAEDVTPEASHDLAEALRLDPCPRCRRQDATVEWQRSHHIWSYLKGYSSRIEATLCCRRCGKRANVFATVGSLVAGWWSIPGLFLTPLHVARNIREVRRLDGASEASPALVEFARMVLAEALLDSKEPDIEGDAVHALPDPRATPR